MTSLFVYNDVKKMGFVCNMRYNCYLCILKINAVKNSIFTIIKHKRK